MVHSKKPKFGQKKGAFEKAGKPQPKKPQLQFASSDEDEEMVQFQNSKPGHKKGNGTFEKPGKTQLEKPGKTQLEKPGKNQLEKQGKTQPKKPQLQFASSDDDTSEEELEIDAEDEFEDEDDGAEDVEGEDGFEDEDMMDGEDELEDEDGAEEAEEESDLSDLSEESDEDSGPLTKTPVKGGLLKGLQQTSAKGKAAQATPKQVMNGHGDADNKKTPKSALKGAKPESTTSAKSKKNVDFNAVPSPAPTKTPSTPHPSSAKAKANNADTSKAAKIDETPQSKKALKKQASETGGVKRKAADNDSSEGVPVPKQAKLDVEIMNEEKRRRDERNKRTLFLKHVGKQVRKLSDLKGLHPDIVSVRTVGMNAWLIFPTEAACNKAHDQLAKTKVKGQSLNVDFCGEKSKNAAKTLKYNERPINKKAVMIQGLPRDITSEKLKIIFPASKEIEIPEYKNMRKNLSRIAFVKFANEQDARAAFKKGETLKIGGEPVEVLFARERRE